MISAFCHRILFSLSVRSCDLKNNIHTQVLSRIIYIYLVQARMRKNDKVRAIVRYFFPFANNKIATKWFGVNVQLSWHL